MQWGANKKEVRQRASAGGTRNDVRSKRENIWKRSQEAVGWRRTKSSMLSHIEHSSQMYKKKRTNKQTNTYYARCITKSIEKLHTMCIELRQVLPICIDFHTLRCTVCHRCRRWNDDSKRACDCCVRAGASASAAVCAYSEKYVHRIQKPAIHTSHLILANALISQSTPHGWICLYKISI